MLNFERIPNQANEIKRAIDKVAINKNGQVALPSYFVQKNNIREYKAANFYWDGQNNVLAIVFTGEEGEGTYPISFSSKYGATIKSARRFFQGRFDYEGNAGRRPYEILSSEAAGIPGVERVYVVYLTRKEGASEEG